MDKIDEIVALLEKVYGYIKGYRQPDVINAFRCELEAIPYLSHLQEQPREEIDY